MKRIGMVIGLYILMTAPMNAGAVTLNVMDGQLMGAEEVIVEGISYDVQFVDGTCAGLIDGCNAWAHSCLTHKWRQKMQQTRC